MAIKLLIGGSPCTNWSIAQKNSRETAAEGVGWELFKNYIIVREKFRPDFFLYENNKSASQVIKDQIAHELGVGVDPQAKLTYINSALVSAQNRQRFYVTNFGEIMQPADQGIFLKDILETGHNLTNGEKSYCLTASYNGACAWNTIERHQRTMVAEKVCTTRGNSEKTQCLRASYYKCGNRRNLLENLVRGRGYEGICEPVYVAQRGRYNESTITQQYEVRPDGKANTLVTVQKDNAVCEPVNAPCRVGAVSEKTGQGDGNYSLDGKSVCLSANGGGRGTKISLYAIPIKFINDVPTTAMSCTDGKEYPVYQIVNSQITIKDKKYPTKLSDGYYIVRKLTVVECCRLQTMPDDYCSVVSATQAYKGLGNGWTAEVIIHLLGHALQDVPRDEELIVLSLYDGIATGRYCLNEMGFTNIKYHAYEIDKYAMAIAMSNYSDIIQHGDAFAVRGNTWKPPQTRSEWLDELLEVI